MAKRQRNAVKAEVSKLGKAVTPKGIAAWAYLNEPAEGLDRDRQKITLFLTKTDPELKEFLKKLTAARDTFAKECGVKVESIAFPVKLATEKETSKIKGIDLGTPFIEFNTNPREKNGVVVPVPVVGADAKPTDTEVWGGDIVRVQCSIAGWKNAGKYGLKCYLNGVQLLQSNRQGGSGTDMFNADEAFESSTEEAAFSPEPAGDNDSALAGLMGD